MCGIAGIFNFDSSHVLELELRKMLSALRHRGPDQFGIYIDKQAGLGNARLSIIDLKTGQQPICNEDGTLWIVFNGEIFNYKELRTELGRMGHQFSTETDTEVILHLYEVCGPDCLNRLNGQFSIAIWDSNKKSLFLGRDRLGVRPLFYANSSKGLVFASEIKSILATGKVNAQWDPVALDQVFTYWSTLTPRTVFKGITEVPPGHFLYASDGVVIVRKYWELSFPEEKDCQSPTKRVLDEALQQFRELLVDATTIRLRADVPVGAYLSGGLDSSLLSAIIRGRSSARLDTFSIAFSDERFDESEHQMRMARFLGTDHQVVRATHEDIGSVFPDVIWHTETPILRTSPAPMFLLSKLVRDRNYKVVLTGEGADEFLGGYDIFKEAKIRRFWARQPDSKWRQLLLKRLYSDVSDFSYNNIHFLSAFFSDQLTNVDLPEYSHLIRWKNTSRTKRFFSQELTSAVEQGLKGTANAVNYPDRFMKWGPLQRAQFLESSIFLSQYLLSSQGDRMGMAHSVEGRFPFLDYRVVEFCSHLPATWKIRGLTEKYLLKRLGQEFLPPEIWGRVKRPYRAPIHRSFFNPRAPAYVRELLSPEQIKASGLFEPAAVSGLVRKIERGNGISETDDMALAGILSAQLVNQQFMSHFDVPPPLSDKDDVKTCKQHMKGNSYAIQ
jgi:asparagine synthase (glutamine-hydrolysing)